MLNLTHTDKAQFKTNGDNRDIKEKVLYLMHNGLNMLRTAEMTGLLINLDSCF